MSILPNPFLCALEAAMPAHSAAAPDLTDPPVAAADDFRFVLDEAAFVRAIEPPICADELVDVLAVLAGY